MKRGFLIVSIVFLGGSPVSAGPFYINSQGARIDLTQAGSTSVTGSLASGKMVFSVPGSQLTFSLGRQLIVRLREGQDLESVIAGTGLQTVRELGHDGRTYLCRAAGADQALTASVAVSGQSGVEWALPDFRVPIKLYYQPSDPYYANQWHHHQDSGADIGSEDAWDITRGDSQVVVAVIDTGVDTGHPDLEAARILTGYNAVNGSNDPTPLSNAVDGHGTCCSGEILSSADNAEGGSGVCPKCSLLPIKMMDGQASTAQLSQGYLAIQYATDHGAWVLSNSWGIDEQVIGQVDIQPYYQAVQDAVNNGRDGKGAVVLFASGNGNQYTGQAEQIGAHELQAQSYVMAVGGTGTGDTVVSYSDYGPNLSVVAPTGAVNMTNPQDMFDGPQIMTIDVRGDGGFSRGGWYYTMGLWGDQKTNFQEIDSTGNYTMYFNGTSAACPIAAGVVALVFSANPNLTGAQARAIVEQTADKVGGPYDANGHDDHYGFGRVNAARAVKVAGLGLDNPDGMACAEDINCASGSCHVSGAGATGTCITTCSSAADCPPGNTCEDLGDGTLACSPHCDSDAECVAPQLCLPSGGDNSCQAIQCTDGSLCPTGTACPPGGGICGRTCAGDSDCVQPELCLPGGGGYLCQEIACTDGSECPDGTACPTEGGDCLRSCGSDADCDAADLCLPAGGGDLCQTIACTTGNECPAGSACPTQGGNCLRVCQSDGDCAAPALCLPAGSGDLCQEISCASDSDCPEGSECGSGGTCQRPGGGGGCGCAAAGRNRDGLIVLLLLIGLCILRGKSR